jgi:hypothetical protein
MSMRRFFETTALPSAEGDLHRRRWVWHAVSDLFLDEPAEEFLLRQIAKTAAECGYTDDELDAIFRREVAPAVGYNVISVAGVWGYFDTEWLEEQILRPNPIVYWMGRLWYGPIACVMLSSVWRSVMSYLPEERATVAAMRLDPAWKPCCSNNAPVYRWGHGD